MRRSSISALVVAVLAATAAQADVIIPGQPYRPARPPPPEGEERASATAAIRGTGHDCPAVETLGPAAPGDATVVGRKDYRAYRARCSNGKTFLVGLPYDWHGGPVSPRVVVKPLP